MASISIHLNAYLCMLWLSPENAYSKLELDHMPLEVGNNVVEVGTFLQEPEELKMFPISLVEDERLELQVLKNKSLVHQHLTLSEKL